jgi:UDP-N-acetylmuramate--alanine ligase
VNIENSVAAMAVAWLNGVSSHELRSGLSSFSGVARRFNVHVHSARVAYIDDYAHHPQELLASVESIRRLFPDRYSLVVFQPHLYTRTRDFIDEFAHVLSRADEVVLLPIYPARELPIPGVTSEALLEKLTSPRKSLVEKPELVETVVKRIKEIDRPVAVMTLGAGDIDRLVPAMKKALAAIK